MSLSFQEVDQILRIIEEFPASEVRFEYGDLKLYVKREAAAGSRREAAAASQLSAPPDAAAPTTPRALDAEALPEVRDHKTAAPPVREGLLAISAPMMGVYYAAPAPGAEPFVKVGQRVSEGTDLCIIEVMKIMNMIKAPCAGTVVEIVAANGHTVERGSAILWIEPQEPPGDAA